MKKRCNNKAYYAVAFGLGLVISCFCPTGLTMFIMAVIIIALGLALLYS
ncbi:Putative lipoprotein [Ruminococcaceae bacterium BL-6]|jgi:uncharacterized membrane protein|nr:Putative lipoprotein [Ruminococcaceae bacterium BL-6]